MIYEEKQGEDPWQKSDPWQKPQNGWRREVVKMCCTAMFLSFDSFVSG